ncbi:MAG: UDP-N-acetylglucosamine 2-epimerase [Acidobacteria bacterium]|uniref:UDP-N-acetylglucosamine 2-epimerase n=1 Tax=Candidatus Polarisedimenticola svalbardensis TaxID=2886004 RepID=A0A8J7C1L9_9BACT|nr:UDP-N-acetylglucosamine 2-epimerase [Candidatus Polarisedimenticola svalbardensis]
MLGTKAQLIKMAPVMRLFRRRNIPYNFIATGQHKETMTGLLKDFNLPQPDITLYSGPDITSPLRMFAWAARILFRSLTSRKQIFGNDHNGIVLVHGDTLSTVLGALIGRLAGLKVGHVESGLRSFRMFHPFPEELTRRITFRLSHILFCPGEWAVKNVSHMKKTIIDTGCNTMIEIAALSKDLSARTDHVPKGIFCLASIHRFENIFNQSTFRELIAHLEQIANSTPLVFILHPPTEQQLHRYKLYTRLEDNPRIELRPRYSYLDFAALLRKAEFVVTDGGSLQEESSYLGIPCLLMRKATERQEGLGGNVCLSRLDSRTIRNFIENYSEHRCPALSCDIAPSEAIADEVDTYR